MPSSPKLKYEFVVISGIKPKFYQNVTVNENLDKRTSELARDGLLSDIFILSVKAKCVFYLKKTNELKRLSKIQLLTRMS